MDEALASASSAGGDQRPIPIRHQAAPSAGEPAAPMAGGGQELRQLFCEQGGRMRDRPEAHRPGRRSRRVAIAVDEDVYQAFQARCQQHDITVAMALQLLIGGRDLPAVRPVVIPLPAEIDAEALRVLHGLEQRLADCQADGMVDAGAVGAMSQLLAGISAGLGGSRCACARHPHAPPPLPACGDQK